MKILLFLIGVILIILSIISMNQVPSNIHNSGLISGIILFFGVANACLFFSVGMLLNYFEGLYDHFKIESTSEAKTMTKEEREALQINQNIDSATKDNSNKVDP